MAHGVRRAALVGVLLLVVLLVVLLLYVAHVVRRHQAHGMNEKGERRESGADKLVGAGEQGHVASRRVQT
jgi:hypothetical protein